VADAIAQSLAALHWLQAQGAQQIYFKYCSTFDSTAAGNIGPVTEALMDALADQPGADFSIATPAFPDNQRTVFKGHLFVGDVLLSESGMQNHPLTPMTDANLVRVLQAQCQRKVGLIDYKVVALGPQAIQSRIAQLRAQGVGLAVVDAISNEDLLRLGPALKGMPLHCPRPRDCRRWCRAVARWPPTGKCRPLSQRACRPWRWNRCAWPPTPMAR
jgi:uncharacterized protein YgbK (DUF1537 family)